MYMNSVADIECVDRLTIRINAESVIFLAVLSGPFNSLIPSVLVFLTPFSGKGDRYRPGAGLWLKAPRAFMICSMDDQPRSTFIC
jgi:hypothetical protein